MNTKQKAKLKAHQIYDQYWSAVSRRPASNKDPLPDIRPLIEKALIEFEEAGAKREREACIKLSALIADKIWDYCQSVEWGTGRAMMEQREIEQIIIDTIRARAEGDTQKGD